MAVTHPQKRRAPTDDVGPRAKRVQRASPTSSSTSRSLRPAVHNAAPSQRLRVYVFGDETSGELGLSSKIPTEILSPCLNHSLDGVVSLATGGMHAAALTANGDVLTWGVNDHHALGRNTTWNEDEDEDVELNPFESTPTRITHDGLPADLKFVQVAACDSATFFLAEDGSVYGCGTFRDHRGILGFCVDPRSIGHDFTRIQKTARRIHGVRDITSLCAGSDFILALDSHGVVFAWGDGQSYQLGRRISTRGSATSTLTPKPVSLPKSVDIASIHTGNFHAFAIDTKGDTWAWGMNNGGQTGIAETAGQDKAAVILPQKVPSLVGRHMRMLAGGQHHSVGLTSSGECLAWGRMDSAQLGLASSDVPIHDPSKVMLNEVGKPVILLEPTRLPIQSCVHVAASSDHSFAVTKDGRVYSWGFNDGGQCGQGTDSDVTWAAIVEASVLRGQRIVWAGAGGRYGMLAAEMDK